MNANKKIFVGTFGGQAFLEMGKPNDEMTGPLRRREREGGGGWETSR